MFHEKEISFNNTWILGIWTYFEGFGYTLYNQKKTSSLKRHHVSPHDTTFFCLVIQDVKTNKSLGIVEEKMVKLDNSRTSLICYFLIEEDKMVCLNDV